MNNTTFRKEEMNDSKIWKFPGIFKRLKSYRKFEKDMDQFNNNTSQLFMFSTKSFSHKTRKIIISQNETSNRNLSKLKEKKKKIRRNKTIKMLCLNQQQMQLNTQNKSSVKSEKFFITESKESIKDAYQNYNSLKNKTVFVKNNLPITRYNTHNRSSINNSSFGNSSLNNSNFKEYLMLSGRNSIIKQNKFLPKILKEEVKNIKNDISTINDTINKRKITTNDCNLKTKIDHCLWKYGKSEVDKYFSQIKNNLKINRIFDINGILSIKDKNVLNLFGNLQNESNEEEDNGDKLYAKNNKNKSIAKLIKSDREIYMNKISKFEKKYKDIILRQKKEKKQRKIINDLLDENNINLKKIKNWIH